MNKKAIIVIGIILAILIAGYFYTQNKGKTAPKRSVKASELKNIHAGGK